MKFILGIVLSVLIVFFVWNILKRIFFKAFYTFPKNTSAKPSSSDTKEKIKSGKHGLNWDAETVEYEEIKEDQKTKS